MNNLTFDIAASIGELLGLGVAFLIIDGIAWYIGKWIIQKKN